MIVIKSMVRFGMDQAIDEGFGRGVGSRRGGGGGGEGVVIAQ